MAAQLADSGRRPRQRHKAHSGSGSQTRSLFSTTLAPTKPSWLGCPAVRATRCGSRGAPGPRPRGTLQRADERLGYGPGYPLLVAAVGGTAVGRDLLELTAEGFAHLRKEEPDARMMMVTGPWIDPADLPDVEGLDRTGYVHNLFEHLACADAASGGA